MTPDEDQLRLLSIFHYVVAGIAALFSLFPVIHIVMDAMIVSGRFDNAAGPPGNDMVGWLFIALGLMFLVAGLAFSVCIALAGRFISQRRSYMFCLVIAAVQCAFVPFGTVLGVFTIVALQKPSVRQLFGRA